MNTFKKIYLASVLVGATVLGLYERACQPTVEAKESSQTVYSLEHAHKQIESLENHVQNIRDAVPKARYVIPSPVDIGIIEPPQEFDFKQDDQTEEITNWPLFKGEYNNSSDFIGNVDNDLFLEARKPVEKGLAKKIKKLIKAETLRLFTRPLKKQWEDQYKESNMSYAIFMKVKKQLGTIGKDMSEAREYDSVREDMKYALRNDNNEEDDSENYIPLFSLGPATLYTNGSLSFDPDSLGGINKDMDEVKIAEDANTSSMLSDRWVIDTRAGISSFNPVRAISEKSPLATLARGYVEVRFDYFTPIEETKRKLFSLEFEGKVDYKGEAEAIANFVLPLR